MEGKELRKTSRAAQPDSVRNANVACVAGMIETTSLAAGGFHCHPGQDGFANPDPGSTSRYFNRSRIMFLS